MKIVYEYSHLGGSEILKVRYPRIDKQVYEVIRAVRPARTKISKEKTMRGKELYSPVEMNRDFTSLFNERGFKELGSSGFRVGECNSSARSGLMKMDDPKTINNLIITLCAEPLPSLPLLHSFFRYLSA